MGQCMACAGFISPSKEKDKEDRYLSIPTPLPHLEECELSEDAVHLCVSTPKEDFSTLRQLSQTWHDNFATDVARWMFSDYWIPHSGNWSSKKTISEIIDDLNALDNKASQRPVVVQLDYGPMKVFPTAEHAVMHVALWSQQSKIFELRRNVSWAWAASWSPFRWSRSKPLVELLEDLKAISIDRPVIIQAENGATATFDSIADAVSKLSGEQPVPKRSDSSIRSLRSSASIISRLTGDFDSCDLHQPEDPLKYDESRLTWAWRDSWPGARYRSLWFGRLRRPGDLVKELEGVGAKAAHRPIIIRVQRDKGREKIFENAKVAVDALLRWKKSSSKYFWRKDSGQLSKSSSRDSNYISRFCTPASLQALPTIKSEPEGSDFSGMWEVIPSQTEGLESILEASEVGYLLRKAALALARTFVPKMEITIEEQKFLIVVTGVKGPESMEFVVGGPSFTSTFGPQKLAGTGKAFWDGSVLVLDVQMNGQSTETRRWIEDGMLKDKTILKKGARVGVMTRTWKPISSGN